MRPAGMQNMNAYRQQKWEKFEVRRAYTGTWLVEMLDAPCQHPSCCLLSILCPHATSFILRRQALNQDMRRYSCCQGYSFCAPNCFGEQNCPDVCLAVETLLCFPNSVLATRFYLQDQMVLQNTQCDNNLMACEMALLQLSCICDCAALLSNNEDIRELAGLVHCVADHVYCSMCACMQTQHKIQMDARDRGELTVPVMPMHAPAVQMMETPGGLVAGEAPIAHGIPQGAPGMPPGAYPLQPPGSYYVQPGAPQPAMGFPAGGYPMQQQPPPPHMVAYAQAPQPGAFYVPQQQQQPGYGPPPPPHM